MHGDNHTSRWVKNEAAKHTTPDSIRRRIDEEIKIIRTLWDTGVTEELMVEALENHKELIRVLTDRLNEFK